MVIPMNNIKTPDNKRNSSNKDNAIELESKDDHTDLFDLN